MPIKCYQTFKLWFGLRPFLPWRHGRKFFRRSKPVEIFSREFLAHLAKSCLAKVSSRVKVVGQGQPGKLQEFPGLLLLSRSVLHRQSLNRFSAKICDTVSTREKRSSSPMKFPKKQFPNAHSRPVSAKLCTSQTSQNCQYTKTVTNLV